MSTSPSTSKAVEESQKSLIFEVKQLNQIAIENKSKQDDCDHSNDAKYLAARQKSCIEFFETLKKLLPDQIKRYATYGRMEARIIDFKIKDDKKIGDFYAKDLLTKGDVIKRLQEYLDTEHADENGKSAFFVYFTHIGMKQAIRGEDKFGVFVNWDKDSWEEIRQRLGINNRIRSNYREVDGHSENRGSRGRGRSNYHTPRYPGRPGTKYVGRPQRQFEGTELQEDDIPEQHVEETSVSVRKEEKKEEKEEKEEEEKKEEKKEAEEEEKTKSKSKSKSKSKKN